MRGPKDLDLHVDGILVGAAVTAMYLLWRSYGTKKPVQLPNPLSEEVDAATMHRKSILCRNKKVMNSFDPLIKTIPHLFQSGLQGNPDGEVFGMRDGDGPYTWITFSEAATSIKEFKAGLLELGLPAGQESMLGIFAQNCPQWHMTMQACVQNRQVCVPLYLTLGDIALTHILSETEVNTVVVDNNSFKRISDFIGGDSKISTVISIGALTEEEKTQMDRLGLRVFTWDEVCELGKASTLPVAPMPEPEDIAIICYTSGTTGKPKGAMLSHGNVVGCMSGVWRQLWCFQHLFDKEECIISYLPTAHVYGFVSECIVLFIGGRVGYFRGDPKLLLDDILNLQPTIFPAVPRVLNKIYDKVNAQLEARGSLVKNLFDYGVSCKLAEVEAGICRQNSIWDYLFFSKIQAKLGGKVKIIMTGSAPMQAHVIQWFRAVMGCIIVEGYGQTETTASTSALLTGDTQPAHVGVPPVDTEIKLVDVPEMGYFVKDRVGEVYVKGPIVFQGYFKNPEKTKEVLTEDGWVASGDIGTWTPEGRLKLIDRKKNLFKLAQGEYIAPEKIEIVYERSPYVAQFYVYGEPFKATLIGVVILDNLHITTEMSAYKGRPIEELIADPEFNATVLEDMNTLGKRELMSFEQPKKIMLVSEDHAFTVDNDLLTPSFKKKRNHIRDIYQAQLTEMYVGLE